MSIGIKSFDESNNTSTSKKTETKIRSIEICGQKKNGRYAAVSRDLITHKKFSLGTFDTPEEASRAYLSQKSEFEKLSQQENKKNFDQFQQPESSSVVSRRNKRIDSHGKEPGSSKVKSGLMTNVRGAESSDECPKAKISLIGIQRRKNGRYVARTTDPITHKQIHVGTFDTIEEASQAYLSKKSEFEKLSQQGKAGNKRKKNCDQNQQPESSSVVASLDAAAASARGRGKRSDSHKRTTHIIGAYKCKKTGRYYSKITNPITKEKISLGTFATAEEASRAFQSKKLKLQKLVKVKKEQYVNKHSHSKQDDTLSGGLVNVKRRHENLNCHERFQPESAGGSSSCNGGTGSQEIGIGEEAFRVYQSKNKPVFSCNTTSWNPKAKRSFVGIKRQIDGRYAAVITDRVKHRKVWFDTFDTIEEASQAYLSKKSEFEKINLGNKENTLKKNCDQIQQPESSSVVTSLDTASGSGRGKRIDSHKRTTHIIGAYKCKKTGRYYSKITNPITKKKISLGTFGTAEEASHAFQSKKLEFQQLVKAKQRCTNKQTHSKQERETGKLVNVKQEHENLNCEHESVGGSRIDFPISNSSNGGTDQRINRHETGIAEDDSQSSKEVELQSNMSTDSCAGKYQEGQEDDKDLWMGKWVQLPGDREVMFSLKLGLPVIDNYGSLLGEFSSLDDLSIS